MNSVNSVVVGIDFTPGSAGALREAIRISKWNRAAVRAVYVIDTLVAAELEEALTPLQQDIRRALVDDAKQEWSRFAATIDGAGAVPLEVRIDNRVRGILSVAREASADMLVLGAFASRDPDTGLGSIASSCVRHAMIRVLLVRDTQTGPFKNVVACIDFSPNSLRALDQAARVATQDSAALHVLHVFDAPWHELHYRAPTPEADANFRQQYRAGLERRLSDFAKGLGHELGYLKPKFAVLDHKGHRSGIVEYARQVGADLIVLGTRGRTNLRDVLLGSTAERTLRESPCSVLAVKPEGFSHPLATGEDQPQPQFRATF